jgi:carboxyl-terminal processing protease
MLSQSIGAARLNPRPLCRPHRVAVYDRRRLVLPPAQTYLVTALDLIEQHALYRQRLDWPNIRATAMQQAALAQTPADTYDAIRWVLTQLGEQHSFFATPDQGDAAITSGSYDREVTIPFAQLRPDRIGYLHIPGFRGSPQQCAQYATTLQMQIAQLDASAPIGWMVDLTDNTGGNMWPMLAGLGPLLSEGTIGFFAFPEQPPVPWFYAAGRAGVGNTCLAQTTTGGYTLQTALAPVAILTSMRTASSGEAVALAFCGRAQSCRFGTPTRGLTTANEGFDLPDGATISLTVATFVDRIGRIHEGSIEPDQFVNGDAARLQDVAAAWLHAMIQR